MGRDICQNWGWVFTTMKTSIELKKKAESSLGSRILEQQLEVKCG